MARKPSSNGMSTTATSYYCHLVLYLLMAAMGVTLFILAVFGTHKSGFHLVHDAPECDDGNFCTEDYGLKHMGLTSSCKSYPKPIVPCDDACLVNGSSTCVAGQCVGTCKGNCDGTAEDCPIISAIDFFLYDTNSSGNQLDLVRSCAISSCVYNLTYTGDHTFMLDYLGYDRIYYGDGFNDTNDMSYFQYSPFAALGTYFTTGPYVFNQPLMSTVCLSFIHESDRSCMSAAMLYMYILAEPSPGNLEMNCQYTYKCNEVRTLGGSQIFPSLATQ